MIKKIFNLDALVKVSITDKEITDFEYEKEVKKTFWTSGHSEGYTMYGGITFLTEQELKNGSWSGIKFIVENNIVYYRPEVVLTFSGGVIQRVTFATYEEAKAYGEEQANNNISNQLIL